MNKVSAGLNACFFIWGVCVCVGGGVMGDDCFISRVKLLQKIYCDTIFTTLKQNMQYLHFKDIESEKLCKGS